MNIELSLSSENSYGTQRSMSPSRLHNVFDAKYLFFQISVNIALVSRYYVLYLVFIDSNSYVN